MPPAPGAAAASGDLDITDDLTIRGDAGGLTVIDGGALDTVIEIDPGRIGLNTTITGIIIRNGRAPASGSTLEFAGGGIRNFSSLTLLGVSIMNNTAGVGGGIYSQGLLVMVGGTLQENVALSSGGGLSNRLGTALIEGTVIGGNTALNGAGIDNRAELQLVDGHVVDNVAQARGGGINNDTGTVTIDAGLIGGNNAGNGGGIFNILGSVTLSNVTLSGNNKTSKDLGGGIYSTTGSANEKTTLRMTNATVTDNEGGGLRVIGGAHVDAVLNTIIAGNQDRDCDIFGTTLTSLGHNLDGDGRCFTSGTNGDITSARPGLGPLADNGGPNKTHALSDDSPAIDAGADQGCPADDQRRVRRPQDGDSDGTATCDIGAYEAVPKQIFASDFE